MAATLGDIVKGAVYTAAPIAAAFGAWGVSRGRNVGIPVSGVIASGAAIGAAVVVTWIRRASGDPMAGLGLINVTSRPLGLIDVQSRRSLGMINIQNRQRRW